MKKLAFHLVSGIIFSGIVLTACRHEPELMPGTPEVCFDRDVMLIINSNCNVSGCHGSTDEELPALNTYDDIRNLVEPGKPVHSKLHELITANPNSGNLMPPEPKSALTSQQIDIISTWILQGANHTTCP